MNITPNADGTFLWLQEKRNGPHAWQGMAWSVWYHHNSSSETFLLPPASVKVCLVTCFVVVFFFCILIRLGATNNYAISRMLIGYLLLSIMVQIQKILIYAKHGEWISELQHDTITQQSIHFAALLVPQHFDRVLMQFDGQKEDNRQIENRGQFVKRVQSTTHTLCQIVQMMYTD